MKLYLDENLSPRLAEMLRARGLEVVSAYEVGNAELDDRAQLAYTTREGRAIVTCDIPDFTVLARMPPSQHTGLISSRFGTDESAAIAKGIEAVFRRIQTGFRGCRLRDAYPAR